MSAWVQNQRKCFLLRWGVSQGWERAVKKAASKAVPEGQVTVTRDLIVFSEPRNPKFFASKSPAREEFRQFGAWPGKAVTSERLPYRRAPHCGAVSVLRVEFFVDNADSAPHPRTSAAALRVGLLCLEKATAERLDA
jgi:hypothetical protein